VLQKNNSEDAGNVGRENMFPNKKYRTIYADPPWHEKGGGKLPYKILNGKRQQGVTGFISLKGRHSEKPEEMRKMIEVVSYGPSIELFARKKTDGWDAWGNEICETIQNQKS
jgi:hypothetical protein